MQIFEIVELEEFPFMETREILQGQIIADVLNEESFDKVYLLVDHNTKRIWKYHGPNSSFKLKNYGDILAGKLRIQLRLFNRIHSLNRYSRDDPEFQEILHKPIKGGRAKPIGKRDFPKQKNENIDKGILYSALDKAELKKIVDDVEKQKIKPKDLENYEFPLILKSAEKKIESIMKKESINELTFERQYLLEIFNAELVEISKDDGFPIFKPFVILYFMLRGISINIFGKIIKLRKIYDISPLESRQLAYLYSKINLYLEASQILEKIDRKKSINFKKLYADAIIREGNQFYNRKEFERAARNYERAAQWSSIELLEKEFIHDAFRLAINSWISACRAKEAFRILKNLDHEEAVMILKEIPDKIGETAEYLSSIRDFESSREMLYKAIQRYQLEEDLFDELRFLSQKLTDVLISLFKQQVSEKKKLAAKNTYGEIENLWDSYKVKRVNLDSPLEKLINQFFESNNIGIASILIDKLNSRKLRQQIAKIRDDRGDKYNALKKKEVEEYVIKGIEILRDFVETEHDIISKKDRKKEEVE